MKFSKSLLKRHLTNLINKAQIITDTKTKLSSKDQKKVLMNQFTYNQLVEAQSLMDSNFSKCCELICDIPYRIVEPQPSVTKSRQYVGSILVYSKTDTLRHIIRMLPKETFKNQQVPSNMTNNIIIF